MTAEERPRCEAHGQPGCATCRLIAVTTGAASVIVGQVAAQLRARRLQLQRERRPAPRTGMCAIDGHDWTLGQLDDETRVYRCRRCPATAWRARRG
jgi:hypothetical protein